MGPALGRPEKAIQDGKRIIVTTVEKFPYISQEIGQEHINHTFAIIIDEAHSGQSGRNAANMNLALSGLASDSELDNEDKINAMVEGRKLVKQPVTSPLRLRLKQDGRGVWHAL